MGVSDLISLITTSLLVLLIIRYYLIWRMKIFMHPGLYFALIWLISVISQWYLTKIDLALLPSPELVDELNILVGFTALCFLLFSGYGKYKANLSPPPLNFIYYMPFYKIAAVIIFISAIFIFFASEASFNLASTRLSTSGADNIFVSKSGKSMLFIVAQILTNFNPILSIFAGYLIGEKIQKKKALITSYFWISFPFIISVIFMLTIGGRNPLANGIKFYLLGFAFSLPKMVSRSIRNKILRYTIIILLSFSLFSTFVASQRLEKSGTNSRIIDANAYTSKTIYAFSGIFEYMSAHYWGYQLRRVDTVDPELSWGYKTFYGFIDINIPFSGLLGLGSGSVIDALGLKKIGYLDVYNSGKEATYTTSSTYLSIYDDFGIPGSFFFLFIFTFYTQWLYVRSFNKKYNRTTSIFFFVLCFQFWASSNFSSTYFSPVLNFLLLYYVFDFIQNKFVKQFRNKNRIVIPSKGYDLIQREKKNSSLL